MLNWLNKGKFEFNDGYWGSKCLYIFLSIWLKIMFFGPFIFVHYHLYNWQLVHFTVFMNDYASSPVIVQLD